MKMPKGLKVDLIAIFVVLLILFTLTGCISKPKVVYIHTNTFVPVTINDALLQPVTVTAPPSKADYIGDPSLPIEERLKKQVSLLHNLSTSLYGDFDICSRRIESIKEVNTEIKQRVGKMNKKE